MRVCRRTRTVGLVAAPTLTVSPTGRPISWRRLLTGLAALPFMAALILTAARCPGAEGSTSTGNGEIIVISTIAQTVAIEVVINSRPHIIGGRLAANAVLRKGKKKVALEDFSVGEQVTVSWRVKEYRKEITAMTGEPGPGRQTPADPSAGLPSGGSLRGRAKDAAPYGNVPGSSDALASGMIGTPLMHTVGDRETLLDIARQYNLGYNEMVDLHPDIDPWLPPVGRSLRLPTQRLLPPGKRTGILINIPEMRLYFFGAKGGDPKIITHPIGIGDLDFPTEPGSYVVGSKAINPTWYIPPSLRAKYRVTSVPPGPDNPLGKYWLGLKNTNYGIHGTDIPWSIGRTVTHGCIRMYPEDIGDFFAMIPLGTPIEIIYAPVKVAKIGQEVYLEVHRDIYKAIVDLDAHARDILMALGYWGEVDRQHFAAVVREAHGIPEAIGIGSRYFPQSGSARSSPLPTAAR